MIHLYYAKGLQNRENKYSRDSKYDLYLTINLKTHTFTKRPYLSISFNISLRKN